jgi:hypothetical protein
MVAAAQGPVKRNQLQAASVGSAAAEIEHAASFDIG